MKKIPGNKPFHLVGDTQEEGSNPWDVEPEANMDSAHEFSQDSVAWCEFAFFAACHNLKQVSPDHIMVKAVEAVLEMHQENPNQGKLPLD